MEQIDVDALFSALDAIQAKLTQIEERLDEVHAEAKRAKEAAESLME